MEHKVGDKMFVDYTGKKLSIIDRNTGEIQEVEVFVSILGSSRLTYLEATLSQKKENFIGSLVNTLELGSTTYTNDELIAFLIDSEFDDKENRKIERLINTAKFRYKAYMEEITASATRNLDKNTIARLSSCKFIELKQNILVTGSTGVGKSFMASALGYKACMNCY